VVAALVVEGETGPLVDPPRVNENIVGPQGDSGVPGLTSKPEYLFHQPGADPQASGPWLNEQQPQPRGRGVLAYAKDAAGRRTVHLGDPGLLGTGFPVVYVIRDDPGHERLV
jgi:hypothetical protein